MLRGCSKIVVPYDHSPLSKKALETAIELAKQNADIELDVITVISGNFPATYYDALNIEEIYKVRRQDAIEKLNEVEQKVKEIPNEYEAYILEGNPAESIVEFVKEHDADLVIMGSRGLSGLKEMLLGSVSHQVVQKSTCPVFIMK